MYKVVLMGAPLDTGNRGVSALASSFIKLALQLRPDADISFFTGNKSSAPQILNAPWGQTKINIINHRLSPKAGFKKHLFSIFFVACLQKIIPLQTVKKMLINSIPSLKALSEADFIGDIHGGDSFSDIYGSKRFIVGVLPNIIILLLGKKLILLPQTYGPYKSLLSQKIAKYIFIKSVYIISRDKEGVQVVKKVVGQEGKGINLYFCPDVAFVLDAAIPAKVSIEPPLAQNKSFPLIGLNVSGLLYNGGYTRDNMFGLNYDYKVFVRDLVKRLAEAPENHVLLIPHTFGPAGNINSDPDACRDIIEHLDDTYKNRVHMVMGEYDQFAIKGIIRLCDFFIGSRMHACIAALSQGIPTVGVAYSRKFVGVFESVGAGDMVADARALTADAIIHKILLDFKNRAELKLKLQRIDDAVSQIKEIFQKILGF
jgi:polysaccharide pyruvyl transferase WcaK-like protein